MAFASFEKFFGGKLFPTGEAEIFRQEEYLSVETLLATSLSAEAGMCSRLGET
jgi:hypothetical protein